MDKQENNKDDNNKMPKENPFTTPEGYFENLTERIESRVRQESSADNKLMQFWKSAGNQFALAAGFILFVVIAYSIMHFVIRNGAEDQIPVAQFAEIIESDLENYETDLLMDAYVESQQETLIETESLSEEELIDYLITEDVDIELIINEL